MVNLPLSEINNGDSGLSARTTLNEVIEFVNSGSGWLSGSFTGSFNGTASYAITASYALNGGGNIDTSSLVTTSSFYNFTSSYTVDSASFDARINAINSESLGAGVIAVDVATSQSLRASTYYNGIANDGVGATLTSNANGALGTIDGVTTLLNFRILVKNQASQIENGPYLLTQTGSSGAPFILTRTVDANETSEFSPQIAIPSSGSINKSLIFAQTTEDPVIGTNNIVYTQITSSNLYVSQTPGGTNAVNQIAIYTNNPRQLASGNSTFAYTVTTGQFRIRNVLYQYPLFQGANGTVLMNNGSGVLRWANNFTGSLSGSMTGSLLGTASFATTTLFALNGFPYTGSAQITGSLGVTGSVGHGENILASGSYSHAEGGYTQAIGTYSHAEGFSTIASDFASHAEGDTNQAIGQYSHAEGGANYSYGNYSHVEGSNNQTIGEASHAEGYNNTSGWQAFTVISTISGTASIAGNYTSSFNNSGIVVTDTGFYTFNSQSFSNVNTTLIYLDNTSATFTRIADISNINSPSASNNEGAYSHAEGYNSKAYGYASHAEGAYNTTIGPNSHAEGQNNYSIGPSSHAEGDSNTAVGNSSHAEGNYTQAIGYYSHAEGSGSITLGIASHAEGLGTIASGSYQHVSGQYNTHGDDTSLFIIGNGVDDNNRSDVLRVSGSTVQVTGSLYVTGSQIILNTDLFTVVSPVTSQDLIYVDAFSGITILDDAGNAGLDITNGLRKLYDLAGLDSVDWSNRQLLKSDGSTVSFDWENGNISSSLQVTGSLTVTDGIYGFTPTGSSIITASLSLSSLQPNAWYEVDATSGAITISVDDLPVGSEFHFIATDLSNTVSFASGGGVNLYSAGSLFNINAVNSVVSVKYFEATRAVLYGDRA
jgi:hypothetical protein